MFTEQRARWLYQNYLWLEQNLPKREDGSGARLILPTPQDYPMPNTGDHVFAESVFQTTRGYMGLMQWPCRLVPQADAHQRHQESLRASGLMAPMRDAAGTFAVGDEVEITYAPSGVRDPAGLVATMAHELCHYLLATVKTEPPCGWAEHEPLTDLCAVHEGFGVFLANSAFQFGQWSDAQQSGWQTIKRGYLTEEELGFALGIFVIRTKIPPERPVSFLKPNPREIYRDSLDFITELESDGPPVGVIHF